MRGRVSRASSTTDDRRAAHAGDPYKTWKATPSCSAAARRCGPTSCCDTAIDASRATAATRASTIGADIGRRGAVTMLEFGHRPPEVLEVHDREFVRERDEQRPEVVLVGGGKCGDRRR